MKNNKQSIIPTMSLTEYESFINNDNNDILIRTLVEMQWKGFFRLNEIVQLWTLFYDLRQTTGKDEYHLISKEVLAGFKWKEIIIKSTTERTQFHERVVEVLKLYSEANIRVMYSVFGTHKPIGLNGVGKRYRTYGIQSHSIRRGAALNLYHILNNNGIGDVYSYIQPMLRHQSIESTFRYVRELEISDRRNEVVELLRGNDESKNI